MKMASATTEVRLKYPEGDRSPTTTLRPPASMMPAAMMAPILHMTWTGGEGDGGHSTRP